MSLKNNNVFKLAKMSLCMIVMFMSVMVVVTPNSTYTQASGVPYSEELQLPDIPGTEWIQPAPVNECAQPDPAWIFCDDFEEDRSSQYFEGANYVSNNRVEGMGWNGSTAVKGTFAQGATSAGGMKVAFGNTPDPDYVVPVSHAGENLREVYYRMYLKHEENWIGGGGDKLSRIMSLAENWAQPFAGYIWSGSSTPGNTASHYLLLDPVSGTDEEGNLKSTKYSDSDNQRWLGAKSGLSPIFSPDNVGKWYSIEVHVKLNDPGQSNGIFQYWINNTLQASKTDLNWVGDYDAYGINAIFFEHFWNSGSPQEQTRYFDNIVISTEKIDKNFDVNPESVFGGNAQLGWHAPEGLIEGGELIVSTDGTYDFGADGPIMLYRQTLSEATAGTGLSTNSYGRGTVTAGNNGSPMVDAVPELPYGKGIVVGSPYKTVYVVDSEEHSDFYEHFYLYWPAEHQDNSLNDLIDAQTGWQIKQIWHYQTATGYSDTKYNSVRAGDPLWVPSGDYFSNGYKITSNANPTSTFDRTASGLRDPNNTQRWRSAPMVRQLWVKSGPVIGEAVGSDGLYRLTDTSEGLIQSQTYKDAGYWTHANALGVGFDRFSMPGYVQGFDISKDQHLYFADVYQTVGPGAAARIEITDNANYDESKLITILDVQDWTNNEVSATIRKGIFYQESLEGKHLHLHDANNTHLYIGQLIDNNETEPEPPSEPTHIVGQLKQIEVTAEELEQGILIEAEDFTHQENGTVLVAFRDGASHTTNNPDGNAFLNWDHTDHLLEWEFQVPESGNYRIGMRYGTNATDSVRRFSLNDGQEYLFHYPQSPGGWNDRYNVVLQTVNGDEASDLVFYLEKDTTHTIRMINVTSGLNFDYLLVQEAQTEGPMQPLIGGTADIIGSHSSFQAGSDLELEIGLSELNGSFTALDVIIDYDPDVLSFETISSGASVSLAESAIELLKPNYAVMNAINEAQGKIRIIMFTQDEQYAIKNVGSLFKLHAGVKGTAVPGVTSVTFDKLDVSQFDAAVSLDISEAAYSLQIRLADNAALATAIASAQDLHDQATEGTLPGQYIAGSKATLQAAIHAATTVNADIHAAQAEVDAALQTLNNAIVAFNLSVIPSVAVDKTILNAAIASAQSRYDKAEEGNRVGRYETGSKAALHTAIATAGAIYSLHDATQTQVDQAVAALNGALSAFAAQLVTLVPGASAVTIADLSIIVRYYGATQDDANWGEIEKADIFNTGEITIQTLAAIAQMILDDWLQD